MSIVFSDNSPSSDIGAARFSPTQGSFRSVQFSGAGTHQVHGCASDILQPVSCKTVLRQSPTGPCHDSAAGNRQWSLCCVAGNSLVCSSIAFVLSLCWNRHWVQVLRLCTCVDDGNMLRSWKWLLYVLNVLYILYVICVLCIFYLLFCFGRMVEVDWIPDCIRAWLQKARTSCHPCRAY